MNDELKPCPFCGSEAQFVEVSDTMGSMKLTAWKVQCSKCWCSPYPNNAHGDKHVVARQWNTRVERTCHLSDKPPDSQERIDQDAGKGPCEYFGHDGMPCGDGGECRAASSHDSCYTCQRLDLLRRQRKLDGVSE